MNDRTRRQDPSIPHVLTARKTVFIAVAVLVIWAGSAAARRALRPARRRASPDRAGSRCHPDDGGFF